MSFAMFEQVPHIVSRFPSLSDISLQDWSEEGIRIFKLQPSHVIEEGQFLEYAILVLEGTVRMYRISSKGREVTLYTVMAGSAVLS